MSDAIQIRLRAFAQAVLERRGALVEWPEPFDEGLAVLTPELAGALNAPEVLRLSLHPESGGLCANLATDFLERLDPLVDAEPRTGAFQIPELYLKRGGMEEPVARAFTWQNARAKFKESRAARAEYHQWFFLASLQSEEQWEDVFSLTLNAASGSEVEFPESWGIDGLQAQPEMQSANPGATGTYARALRRAGAQAERRSAAFVGRLEARLARDRKRIREYYKALLKDAEKKTGKAGGENADASRAVELELRRKLGELDERYAIKAELKPLALMRIDLPVLAIQIDIQRKQASRTHTLYWNPLNAALEPLCCGKCGAGIFSVFFTDNDVAPRCAACAEPK